LPSPPRLGKDEELKRRTEQAAYTLELRNLSAFFRMAIAKTVQYYTDGAKSGRGADMQPAFHQDATIFGYADGEIFAGPIQKLFESVDQDTPATGLQARMVSIDIINTIAAVRLELDDWNGHRYTDLLTLLKANGEWKIMNKVFHEHP
jgi:hypothetical protein